MKKLIPLVLPLLLMGCVSTHPFTAIPLEQAEFQRDLADLKVQYPDIGRYLEGAAPGERPRNTPYLTDLIEKWGPPQESQQRWLLYLTLPIVGGAIGALPGGATPLELVAISFVNMPLPPKKLTWIKGKYRIDVKTFNTVVRLYRARIISWEWSPLEAEGIVSEQTVGAK